MRLVLLYATLLLAASTKYTTIYVDALPLSPDSIAKLNSSSNQTAQASLDYVKLVRRLKTNSDSTFELSVIKNLDPMVKINNNKRLVKPVTGYEATGIKAAKEAKLTGQGINIGIIDSGIDYLHPALGGCFGKECRVAVGMNLYGRSIADIHSRKDRGDPMDCYGHGTKVAGIIGAQTNTFVGIAPKATLGAYRIAGCDESAANEGLIKLALDVAADDGMHIVLLSMSINTHESVTMPVVYAQSAAIKGLTVIVSAGNLVEQSMWQARAPGIAPSVISVSGAEMPDPSSYWFSITGDPKALRIPYNIVCPMPQSNRRKIYATLATSLTDEKAMASCDITNNVMGSYVVSPSNSCKIDQLIQKAKQANALGVIASAAQYGQIYDTFSCSVPFFELAIPNIQYIRQMLDRKPKVELNLLNQFGVEPTADEFYGDTRAAWGPTPWLTSNADITAPSSPLLSTTMNGKKIATFNHISGTSFAAPYMAAAVALYFEKHGVQKDIHALRSLLQTTSKPVRSPFSPLISSVAQQGSGLFNIQRAIAETTRVNPSMLLLGEYPTGVAATINKRLEISNFGSTVKVYRVSHLPAATVRGYDARGQPIYPPEHRDAPASVKFSKAITVPAQASTTLSIDITPPENVPFIENWVYSGYIQLDLINANGKIVPGQTLSVSYFGLKGQTRSLSVVKLNKLRNLLKSTRKPERSGSAKRLKIEAAT